MRLFDRGGDLPLDFLGPRDGATVLICTCTGVVSGNASTSNRRRANTPPIAATATAAITIARLRSDKSMMRLRMFIG